MKKEGFALLAIVVLAVAGWFFRHDIQVGRAGGEGNIAPVYMLNRWTGTVYIVTPKSVRELDNEKPYRPQESKLWDDFEKSQTDQRGNAPAK